MEHFGSGTMAKTSFLADNGSSSFNRNMWESTSMHPPAVPWPLFTDTPSTSHSEFPNCNMYLHFHGTTRTQSRPLDRFHYNYEPAMFSPYISGVPPLVPAMPLTTNVKSAQNDNTRKLTCEICKKMFLRPSALKVHMRIHNGEKPFQCTHCPRAFTQSGNLTVHLRMHTGERPFMCTFCGKGFSQSNTVRVHLRTHTGEKPFQCMECLKCFSDRSTLIKHHRVHVNAGVRQNRDS